MVVAKALARGVAAVSLVWRVTPSCLLERGAVWLRRALRRGDEARCSTFTPS